MLSGANRVIKPVSDLASAVHMPPFWKSSVHLANDHP